MKRRTFVSALTLAMAAPGLARAQAANYPEKPVRWIVPVAAGGTTDVIARVVASRINEVWDQSIVVENIAGGASLPATKAALAAKPDGYTMFVGTIGALTVSPYMFPDMKDPIINGFVPVTLFASAPTMLVVNPTVPVKTVRELVDYGKAHPGQLNFPSPGNGTSPHLAGELFKQLAGIDAQHVPYKGAAFALTDLLAGRVQFMFDNIITSLPYVKAGKLRALAVTARTRSALVPDVPTMAEAGLPGQEISGWVGLVTPTGTPREIILKMQRESSRQLQRQDVRDAIVGADAVGNTPEEFGAFLASERAKWSKLVRDAHIEAST